MPAHPGRDRVLRQPGLVPEFPQCLRQAALPHNRDVVGQISCPSSRALPAPCRPGGMWAG